MRILIVEDDAATALAIRGALEGAGWEVCGEANSLSDGRRAARELTPDVLVADIKLPDGSGLDLVQELWDEARAPAVIVTAYADDELQWRAEDSGGFGYLIKPVTASALVASVRMAWARARDQLALRGRLATLHDTLESRKLIERAKGFLMDHEGLSEEAAYLWLQRRSRDTNTPMEAVAGAVIEQYRSRPGGPRGEKDRAHRVGGRHRSPAADGEERLRP